MTKKHSEASFARGEIYNKHTLADLRVALNIYQDTSLPKAKLNPYSGQNVSDIIMFHQMQKELKAAKKKQKRKNRKEQLDSGLGEVVNIEGVIDGKV